MFASKDTLLTRPNGYQIQRSLRFRSSASAYLNRTFGSGNRKTYTLSFWVKRGALGRMNIFVPGDNATSGGLSIAADNTIEINNRVGGTNAFLITSQVFRDPSAWYHLVWNVDTTQATASNRSKLYVNGVQVTSFSTANYPAQNADTNINNAIVHWIGRFWESGFEFPFDGYMAEVNFIDGQALTPSSFGAINPVTGVWSATKYAGTYGTNGFYLNFTDNSAATATTIGKDYSGNGNNWTPNNISVTAGATYDSMLDAPLGTGGLERGNYCVMNPLKAGSGSLLSQGNLAWTYSSGSASATPATFSISSGKWYHEVTITSANINHLSGWADATNSVYVDIFNIGATNGIEKSSGSSFTFANNDILGIAFDYDNATITFYKNNTSQFSVSAITLSGALMSPIQGIGSSGGGASSCVYNFGQRPFSYTPPTGFKALHTGNLAAPVIALPAQNMAATLYTGTLLSNAVSNAVNGVSFQPDWVWIKSRSAATDNKFTDSVRGVTKALVSNSTAAETTDTQGLTALSSGGFTVGTDANYNNLTATYVAWQWKAGGTAVSNTSGSITSSVSANTTAGFSVVTYTGTGANATVGHGLGAAPSMIIVKNRSGVANWNVYHASLGNTGCMTLNTTGTFDVNSGKWNNTTPTSTVFSLGGDGTVNTNTANYVSYCFTPVAGYSAFGSYTGNGSTDGPFVFTGMRPRFIMWKRTDTTSSWSMHDTSRDPYNLSTNNLFADSSGAEDTGDSIIDLLSNGFKLRNTYARANASGGTYIYMAFAENPFKNSLAR